MRRVRDWVEERTGWVSSCRRILDEKVPGGARWRYVFGSVLMALFTLQFATGILLSLSYAPTAEDAWQSVRWTTESTHFGGLIRSLHVWGVSVILIVLLLHMAQVLLAGAYRRPREVNWFLGIGLLGLTLAFAFTGSLLPWDQRGYWATRVGMAIAGSLPVIGEPVQRLLQGGTALGTLTLNRFAVIHFVLLPGAFLAALMAHLALVWRHGITSPAGRTVEELGSRAQPFWPFQASKDLAVAGLLLVGLLAVAWCWPAELGDPADPSVSHAARPEWYFLFLFQLLKYFPGTWEVVGAAVVPALLLAILIGVPFLDSSPSLQFRHRRGVVGLMGALFLGLAFLTGQARWEDRVMRRVAMERATGIFTRHCASCHLDTGQGKHAGMPDFTRVEWHARHPEAALRRTILNGKRGKIPPMPAFKGILSDYEIEGLLRHIRGFGGKLDPEAPPEESTVTSPEGNQSTPEPLTTEEAPHDGRRGY